MTDPDRVAQLRERLLPARQCSVGGCGACTMLIDEHGNARHDAGCLFVDTVAALDDLKRESVEWQDKCFAMQVERDGYRIANESVAVCSVHTSEVTDGDGLKDFCLVCEIGWLQEQVEALERDLTGWKARHTTVVEGYDKACEEAERLEAENRELREEIAGYFRGAGTHFCGDDPTTGDVIKVVRFARRLLNERGKG